MTYREYFEEHDDENLSWCKPYANDEEDCFIIMYEGDAGGIVTPDVEAIRCEGTITDDLLEALARKVNTNYDWYSKWSDLHIALDAMHECGCASCPFKDDCDAMGEEMEETDYR